MALIQANFTSMCLKRTVQFSAILPVESMSPLCPPPKMPLKTLYLLHGYTGSSMDWFTMSALGEVAATNGLAIIMPDAENHFYVDDLNRGDMYGAFIGSEIVDFTRKMFPLSAKREDTIIGGISMGGYGALRNGFKYNDVFGHIIAISPAIVSQELQNATDEPNHVGATRGFFESVFGDLHKVADSDMDLHWLVNKLHADKTIFPEIYHACGSNDILVHESRRLNDLLDALGIVHTYEEGPGTHDALFFDPHLRHALEMLDIDRPPILPNPFWMDNE